MSSGSYSQTDKRIVVQVCKVSSREETGSMEGVQVPGVKDRKTELLEEKLFA